MNKQTNWDDFLQETNLRVRHFIRNGKLIGTIMFQRTDDENASVLVGAASVNPIDNGSKEMGRNIAGRRLLSATEKTDPKFWQCHSTVLERAVGYEIPKLGLVPVKTIKSWLQGFHARKYMSDKELNKLPLVIFNVNEIVEPLVAE